MKRSIFLAALLLSLAFVTHAKADAFLILNLSGENQPGDAIAVNWYFSQMVPMQNSYMNQNGGTLLNSLQMADYTEENPPGLQWGCVSQDPQTPCSSAGSGPMTDAWSPIDGEGGPGGES